MRRADILGVHGVTSVEGDQVGVICSKCGAQQQERLCGSDDSTREVVPLVKRAGHRK